MDTSGQRGNPRTRNSRSVREVKRTFASLNNRLLQTILFRVKAFPVGPHRACSAWCPGSSLQTLSHQSNSWCRLLMSAAPLIICEKGLNQDSRHPRAARSTHAFRTLTQTILFNRSRLRHPPSLLRRAKTGVAKFRLKRFLAARRRRRSYPCRRYPRRGGRQGRIPDRAE